MHVINLNSDLLYHASMIHSAIGRSKIPQCNRDRGLTLDRVENPERRPYKAHRRRKKASRGDGATRYDRHRWHRTPGWLTVPGVTCPRSAQTSLPSVDLDSHQAPHKPCWNAETFLKFSEQRVFLDHSYDPSDNDFPISQSGILTGHQFLIMSELCRMIYSLQERITIWDNFKEIYVTQRFIKFIYKFFSFTFFRIWSVKNFSVINTS